MMRIELTAVIRWVCTSADDLDPYAAHRQHSYAYNLLAIRYIQCLCTRQREQQAIHLSRTTRAASHHYDVMHTQKERASILRVPFSVISPQKHSSESIESIDTTLRCRCVENSMRY